MIFAILGIVVLVVSFVIALITLVREQSRLDEVGIAPPDGDKGRVDASLSEKELPVRLASRAKLAGNQEFDPLAAHKAEELSSHQEPLDMPDDMAAGSMVHDADASLEGAADVGTRDEKKPHVWWEKLDENGDRQEEKNKDEESIEKIREELAKLMSTKTNVNVASEEGLAVENRQTLTQGSLAVGTLAGEFSLREIKKKD